MADPQFTVEDDLTEKFQVEDDTPERPSNPIKQGLAGLSDIATGLPAILGLAGAGIQGGFNTLTGEGSLKENFVKALSDDGFDKALLDAGMSGRKAVNEALGIQEPVSTEDQAARLLSSSVIPGSLGISTLGKAATFLTPLVRTGKGFATRAGVQLGASGAIDQGIRALADNPNEPLMFSDRAISGETNAFGEPVVSSAVGKGELAMSPSSLQFEVEDASSPFEVEDDPFIVEDDETEDGFEARREADQQSAKAAEYDTIKFWSMIAGAAAGSYAGAKYAQKIKFKSVTDKLEANPNARLTPGETFSSNLNDASIRETPGVLWNDAAKPIGSFIHDKFADSSTALANAARHQGHNEANIDRMVSNSHSDSIGMGQAVYDTGDFGHGSNITTHAVADLDVEISALTPDQKQVFNEAMLAQSERAGKLAETVPIWGTGRSRNELDAMVIAGRSDKQVKNLMNKFGEVFDAHLDFQVHKKVLTDREARALRAKFTDENGNITYMPIYAKTKVPFYKKMGKMIGIHTGKAKELDIMGELSGRKLDLPPESLDAVDALRQYTVHSIDNAVSNSYQTHMLEALSGIRLNRSLGNTRVFLDGNGKPHATRRPTMEHTGGGTRYLGKGDINPDGIPTRITVLRDVPGHKKYKDGSINDLKAAHPDEIVAVHFEGELHAFHVPDPGIRASLNLNPTIGNKLRFMNHWKNQFTRFTTGDMSLFAPISHMFSNQQVAFNTMAREGFIPGVKSVAQSLGGTKSLMMDNGAKHIAQFLAHRIATNTGMGRWAKEYSINLQDVLHRRFRDSVLNQVRQSSGRLGSGLQTHSISEAAADFGDSMGTEFGRAYGRDQLGLVWRMWKTMNNALHEGPAYGAILKKLDEASVAGRPLNDQVIREAVDHSKTVAGDMRRMGSSKAAKMFNASVPFSSAMVQSWNSIGSAIKYSAKHDKGFNAMTGLATLIGIPTATELVSNAALSLTGATFSDPSGSGKMWTYDDYYWNGFTTQQRADNMIVFLPGKPPWEALIAPISPEFGLMRGAVMEGMDAIFNLSGVGAIGEVSDKKNDVNRNQFLASLARVMDVPIPPVVAAMWSATGVDVRLGLNIDEGSDPDNPGFGLSFGKANPLGKGERFTRRSGKTKFAQGAMDNDMSTIMQDLFGSGGSLYVAMHEAFMSGKKNTAASLGPEDTSLQGVSGAIKALGNGLRRQARWTQPLFGQTLRPKASGEIATSLFNRRAALKRLGNDFNSYFSGGQVDPSGNPTVGNTDVPPNDPINMELSADAKAVESNIALLDKDIGMLRRQVTTMGNATNLGSINERNSKIDAKMLEIQALKAKQLSTILDYEARASEVLTERYKRPVDINLSTFTPRN